MAAHPKIIEVGRGTYGVGSISVLSWDDQAIIRIGSFCSIAQPTIILGGNHRTDWMTTFPFGHTDEGEFSKHFIPKIQGHPSSNGDVIIGNDVWIGLHATIMSGVTIGDGAVIGYNSVVSRDVGPYEIVVGNPARSVKKRFDDEIIDLLLKLRWWELSSDIIRQIYPELCQPPTRDLLLSLIDKYR